MMESETIQLDNDVLRVELDPRRPIVGQYFHKPSGQRFGGGSGEGRLAVNAPR